MKTKWAHHPLSLHVLLLAGIAFAGPALAGTYSFTELAPLSGGAQSTAVAINNLGQVVGTTDFDAACFGCGGTTLATFWNGGTATQVPLPADGNSYAMDINDAGQIVGWTSAKTTTHYSAFLWNSTAGGAPTDPITLQYNDTAYGINNLGEIAGNAWGYSGGGTAVIWSSSSGATSLGSGSFAVDINDAGQVIGRFVNDAVVWNGNAVSVLGNLSGGYSTARAINNAGLVVGQSLTATGYHATVWNGTTPTDLGALGGVSSTAVGLNDLGLVVGAYNDGTGSRAFIWDGTAMSDINSYLDASTMDDGWVLVDASDINDKGQIVGMARNTISGRYSAYVLTPVPEPETYAMVLAGLVLVGVAARHRKH